MSGGEVMQRVNPGWMLVGALALAALSGCPKKIPQPEIDAAEQSMSRLQSLQDCAPETVQAARAAMERAQELMKAERYEEAKTAFIAARNLAEKAQRECDEKKRREAEAEKKRLAELEAQNAARALEPPPPPDGSPGLVTVHFGFNAAELGDQARKDLASNAEYLRARPGLRVQIEGHCDSRGSTEYNLALGERRAISVRQFLTTLGVDPDRLELISFGEERLVSAEETEAAHAQNRRAEFRELR
jgi:peptidoglycan-associated lipoprotein